MDVIQPLAAIVLVMTLLGGALLVLKRRGAVVFSSAGGRRRLEVIERVALTSQHALHLVRMGDREVVISTGPSSCQLLEGKELQS